MTASARLLDGPITQMTARFSQLNHSQSYTRSQRSTSKPAQKNSAREHIKQNTKLIKGEIQGIDDEIAYLQESLMKVSGMKEQTRVSQEADMRASKFLYRSMTP